MEVMGLIGRLDEIAVIYATEIVCIYLQVMEYSLLCSNSDLYSNLIYMLIRLHMH